MTNEVQVLSADNEYELQAYDMMDYPVAVLVLDAYKVANSKQREKIEDLHNSGGVNNAKCFSFIEDIIGKDVLFDYFKRVVPDAKDMGLSLFKLNNKAIKMLSRRVDLGVEIMHDLCLKQEVKKETAAHMCIRLGVGDDFIDVYRTRLIVSTIAGCADTGARGLR